MADNIVNFTKRKTSTNGTKEEERQAWMDYELWISIIKHNIELVRDPDRAWMLLQSSPYEFGNKPYLIGYVCSYLDNVLSKYLEDMNSQVRRDSYINSYLVEDLNRAVSLMNMGHITSLTIWTADEAITTKFSRTWESWHITNLFYNGKSIWDSITEELKEKGHTDVDLFHWKEKEETNNE